MQLVDLGMVYCNFFTSYVYHISHLLPILDPNNNSFYIYFELLERCGTIGYDVIKPKKNCFAFRFFLYRTYSLDILLPSYSSCLSKLRVSSKIMSVFEGEKSKAWKM